MQAEILHSFHQALKNEEFQIYFQTKVRKSSSVGSVTKKRSGPRLCTFHYLNRMVLSSVWIIMFMKKPSDGFRNFPFSFRQIFAFP